MSYHLPNRRAEPPRPAATAKTLTPEGDLPPDPESLEPAPGGPRGQRMVRRWSVAGARFHARFAETGRKTFT